MDEWITIAAVEYQGKRYTGGRHPNIVAEIFGELGCWPVGRKEGFLTNTNRFVDRIEGAAIAFAARQTQSKLDILYSEDIY